MFDLVLKNGNYVTADGVFEGDILLSGDRIVDIVTDFHGQAAEILDCSQKFVLPGLIDAHVHFRTPGQEYKEDWGTGSKAAVASGITTVFDMPNNIPAVISIAALEAKRKLINGRSWVNYALYLGANGNNVNDLKKASHICGLKVYMGSSTGELLVSEKDHIEEIFKQVDNKILSFHAETNSLLRDPGKSMLPEMHSKLRPPEAAYDAVAFILKMSEKYSRRVHLCHVSTAGEVELIRKAKSELVSSEVTPHHLFLDESAYERLGNFVKVNPPLRKAHDREILWQALKDKVIDMVATDHAPHLIAEKEQPYSQAPAGVPGLDTLLPLLLNEVCAGNLTLSEIVLWTANNPARLFGLGDRGHIKPGFGADLVIVDMDERKKVEQETLYTKCAWSPFEGWGLRGWPWATIVNGKIVFKAGVFSGLPSGVEVF